MVVVSGSAQLRGEEESLFDGSRGGMETSFQSGGAGTCRKAILALVICPVTDPFKVG